MGGPRVPYMPKTDKERLATGFWNRTNKVDHSSFIYHSRLVYLIDTPGLDETHRSGTEVLKDVSFYLSKIYEQDIKLAGIIYLHRITDVRMSDSSLRNLKMFKVLCGEEKNVSKHVVLATTMWINLNRPGLSKAVGVEREDELLRTKEWWGMMHKRGSRVYRYTDTRESAMTIVSDLIALRTIVVLDIQRQITNEHKSLEDTSAGQEVEKEIQALKRKQRDELAALQTEIKQALEDNDQKLAAELSRQREETNNKLLAAAKAQRDLRVDFERPQVEQQAQLREQLQEEGERVAEQNRLRDKEYSDTERRREERSAEERAQKRGRW
ncbi:hypothetical protein OEA41_007331 [Lepraria neglecta]|uniref:G domain-containing protein n=1 Tax=Lepraria neglecta TaxID=209136 RepID=A0AAE0DMY9_9LECA|nr:hypothetical protein OEA41_007331 [Lepraria neglecta]